MKYTICIYILLGLSVWIICRIGLGIGVLPLIPNATCIDTDKINIVLLNLSYSYFAGFIVYLLTILVPYWRKMELSKDLLKSVVSAFHLRLYIIYYFYYEPPQNSDIVQRNTDLTDVCKIIEKDIDIDSLLETSLNELSDLYNDFIGEIKDLKDYLSHEQYRIISKIRNNTITRNIRYSAYPNMVNDILNSNEEDFNRLINLMTDLNETVCKKKMNKEI